MRTKQAAERYAKFKFELPDVGVRIVALPDNVTLDKVHRLAQALFGWKNRHPWEFHDDGGIRIQREEWRTGLALSPSDVCLADVLPERGDGIFYVYGQWEHRITRLLHPPSPGIYCVKTIGPDGLEVSTGASRPRRQNVRHVPDAEEITARLRVVKLGSARLSKNLVAEERKRQDDLAKALTPDEWAWLCRLRDADEVELPGNGGRLVELLRAQSGVRLVETPPPAPPRCMVDRAFRHFWKHLQPRWEAVRGGVDITSSAPRKRRHSRRTTEFEQGEDLSETSVRDLQADIGRLDAYRALSGFLYDKWNLDSQNPEDADFVDGVLLELYDFFASGGELRDALEGMADQFDVEGLSVRERAKFVQLLDDAASASRHNAIFGEASETPDPGEPVQESRSSVPAPIVNAFPKIGRNDPCPCGSGKKYKKCCGR